MIKKNNLERIADAIYCNRTRQVSLKSASKFNIDLDEIKQYNQQIMNLNNILFSEEKRQNSIANSSGILAAGVLLGSFATAAVMDNYDVGPVSLVALDTIVGGGLLMYCLFKQENSTENAKDNTLSTLEKDPIFIDEIYARADLIFTFGHKLQSDMNVLQDKYIPALKDFHDVNKKYDAVVGVLKNNSKALTGIMGCINTYTKEGK